MLYRREPNRILRTVRLHVDPNGRPEPHADGVFRAVNSGGPVAITGELRVRVFL